MWRLTLREGSEVRVQHLILTGLAVVLLAACGKDEKPTTTPMRPTAPPMAAIEPEASGAELDEDYRYEPEGKPDPFESFVRVKLSADSGDISSPLERFDLSQLIVIGIVWATRDARALIEDPSGTGYIVGVGTAIGKNRGKVIKIEDNRVLVKETYIDFHDIATTKEVELLLYESQGG